MYKYRHRKSLQKKFCNLRIKHSTNERQLENNNRIKVAPNTINNDVDIHVTYGGFSPVYYLHPA